MLELFDFILNSLNSIIRFIGDFFTYINSFLFELPYFIATTFKELPSFLSSGFSILITAFIIVILFRIIGFIKSSIK